jgi:hypothetical protein
MVSGKGRDWGREYDDVRVDFGYRVYDQETVSAWGARMIVCPGGELDLVWDRQGLYGEDDTSRHEIIKRLNDGGLELIRMGFKDAWESGEVSPRESNELLLIDTSRLQAVGNTNASGGYFYVSAWIPNDASLHLRELIHRFTGNRQKRRSGGSRCGGRAS